MSDDAGVQSRDAFSLAITLRQVDEDVWHAEGEGFPLLLEASTCPRLLGYLVSNMEALGEWITQSLPEDQNIKEYCEAMGLVYDPIEERYEDGFLFAVYGSDRVSPEDTSMHISVKHRLPSLQPLAL